MRRVLPVLAIAGALLAPALAHAQDIADSDALVARLLESNAAWLSPEVDVLSYTFDMQHTDKDDRWTAEIRFAAPDKLTVVREDEAQEISVTNDYDPGNTAYAPRLLSILQGVTMFGPLQELALSPQNRRVVYLGEDDELNARVYSLTALQPEDEQASEDSTPRLAIRVGCGVFRTWYGYTGSAVDEDRIWVDRNTGSVLREEGYQDGKLRFGIEHSEFVNVAGRGNVPLWTRIRRYDDDKPWYFEMSFAVHGNKIRLLDRLVEYHGEIPVAVAWITNVEVD